MPDLRELLTAEAERQRPHLIPPFEQVVARIRRRRTIRRSVLAAGTVTVVVAAFVVTGAVGLRPGSGHAGPVGEPKWTVATACPGWDPEEHVWEARRLPRLPTNFGAVTDAFICETTVKTVPGDGEWFYQEARRITGGLDELLAVYALPDEPRGTSQTIACPTTWQILPPLWLHGRSVLGVRAPAERCGSSTDLAWAAARSLTTEVVASEPLRLFRSQLAVDSWCWQSWEGVGLGSARDGQSPSSERPQTLSPQTEWACTYERSGNTLKLVGTTHLDPGKIAEINVALQQSTTDASCDPRAGTRYTVVEPSGEVNVDTYVALDGCGVLQGDQWWRATDELRALLAPANT